MSALAFFAKCRDQPTAFFLRRSSNSRWFHGRCSIGCGGRESPRRLGLAGDSVSQHGASESFGHGGDS